jgi:hypothetical protein
VDNVHSGELVTVSVPTIADATGQVIPGYIACARVYDEVIAALRAQREDRRRRTIQFDLIRARDLSPAAIAIICGLGRLVIATGERSSRPA